MISNIVFYFCNIILGIISRKVLLSYMGIEYQGINGLFSNILSVLGIAELGIGTAIIFHLYGPLAQKDLPLICSIMNFYKKCYRYIAAAISIIGCLFALNINFFIGEHSISINLTVVYLLMLADVVASYTLTYKRSILYADQNNYIVSLADTGNIVLANVFQIIIIIITKNYYIYIGAKILFRILENILINFIVNKKYSFLVNAPNIPLDKSILKDIKLKVKGLLFHKIGSFVVNGTDNIIISKFINVASVGLYSNYSYIITSVTGLFGQVINATTAGVGNLLVSSEEHKRLKIFNELQYLNFALANFTTVAIYIMCGSFISFFFGEQYVLPDYIVQVLCLNYLLTCARGVYGTFKSAAGIQFEDRFVPIAESIVNLIFSLVLVNKIGFVGVFIGTSISNLCVFCYSFPKFVYKGVLKGKLKNYYLQLIFFLSLVIANCFISKFVCGLFVMESNLKQLLFNGVIALIIPNFNFWILLRNRKEMLYLVNRICKIINRTI